MLKIIKGTLSLQGNTILDDINLDFESGQIYGLVGPNGCGKTTLLKVLCGLNRLSSGEVLYDNKVLDNKYNGDCGIIIEKHDFIGYLTGFENMCHLAEIKRTASKEKIVELMKYFGLDAKDKRKVKSYSLGMKQKLSLVQALMEDPHVLLLDEPTNALDETYIEKFKELLSVLKKEGKIILIATHDMNFMREVADHTILIEEGKVVKCC